MHSEPRMIISKNNYDYAMEHYSSFTEVFDVFAAQSMFIEAAQIEGDSDETSGVFVRVVEFEPAQFHNMSFAANIYEAADSGRFVVSTEFHRFETVAEATALMAERVAKALESY